MRRSAICGHRVRGLSQLDVSEERGRREQRRTYIVSAIRMLQRERHPPRDPFPRARQPSQEALEALLGEVT